MDMKKMLFPLLAACAAFAVCGGERMNAVYTVPHELDALLKGGHVQGASCDESGVYLAHSMGIVKVDWTGKKVAEAFGQSHIGDCGVWKDKVYAAIALRPPKKGADGKKYPGSIGVWDAKTLKFEREQLLPENADGLVVLDGVIHFGVDRWGRHPSPDGDRNKEGNPTALIGRMNLDLKMIDIVEVDFGYNILWGVQTMATDGKDLMFGNYAVKNDRNPKGFNYARCSKDIKLLDARNFGCSEGFGLVPKSVTKRDTPVFFAVRALGGNMQGWRKDPVWKTDPMKNPNPPRIRLDFFEYADGAFADITARDPKIK